MINIDKFDVELLRKYGEFQTLGHLTIYNGLEIIFECDTLELPWKENKQRVSCIPEGNYHITKCLKSPSFKYIHYDIHDVANRTAVKIHAANFVRQLLGCIAVGEKHIDINGDNLKDVTSSKATLKKLVAILPDEFILNIKRDDATI